MKQFAQGPATSVMDIVSDNNGNVYTVGRFKDSVDADPGNGVQYIYSNGSIYDIFISKLDANGQFVWVKSVGGTYPEYPIAIKIDHNNDIIIVGAFVGSTDFDPGPGIANMTCNYLDDVFILKLNSNGNFIWAKQLGTLKGSHEPLAVAIDAMNNIHTVGYFRDSSDFDPGPSSFMMYTNVTTDFFVSKISANGDFVWAKQFKASHGQWAGICTDRYSNLYLTGEYEDSGIFNLPYSPDKDAYITKLDSNGNLLWARQLDGSDQVAGAAIAIDSNDNIYTGGTFSGSVDLNPGPGTSMFSAGDSINVYVLKLNPTGSFVWAKEISGSGVQMAYDMRIDQGANIYIGGRHSQTSNFDPGGSNFLLTSNGGQDAFLAKYDSSGAFQWAGNFGTTGIEYGYALFADENGNVYLTGNFQGSCDFDPGVAVYNLNAAPGSFLPFILKLNSWPDEVNDLTKEASVSLYPNPGHEFFTVDIDREAMMKVYDVWGHSVFETVCHTGNNHLKIPLLPDGIYLAVFRGKRFQISKYIILD